MRIKLLIVLIFLFGIPKNVDSRTVVNNVTVSSDFIQDLFISEIQTNSNFDDILGSIGSNILDARKCVLQLKDIVDQFPSLKVARFIDSWGKFPPGVLYGHLTDLGNYDQCVRTSVVLKEGTEVTNGQYCFASFPILPAVPYPKESLDIARDVLVNPRLDIDLSKILTIKLGICIPDVCDAKLITKIFQKAVANVMGGYLTGVQISKCSVAKKPDFEAFDIFAIVFFSLIGVLMLASTAYDWYTQYFEKKQISLLLAFSIISNGRKLFAIKTTKSTNSIDCLTGIRVLSTIWVLYCHNYMFYTSMDLVNIVDILNWAKRFWTMPILMGTVSVDTFFFLSGLLVAWLCFQELDKTRGKLNYLLMWFHRYIRLTPPLAVVILYYLTINKFIGSGPYREDSIKRHFQCKETWWSTLLYVQNYVSAKNMCVLQSWYLAIDTQLYVLAPLILLPLWKWGKKCIPVFTLLICGAIACVFSVIFIEDYQTLFGFAEPGRTSKVYFPTHIRFPPWLIGIVLGYFMHLNRNKIIRIPVKLQLLGWVISLGTLLAIVFGPYFSMKSSYTVTAFHAAAYEGFKRVSWSIALAWIVFACHFGYGGKVNSILSHPCWQPLGRLTYCLYLVHVAVLTFNFGISRTDVFFSDYTLMLVFWSNFGISLMVSIVLSLSFEAPVLVIEKVIFRSKNQSDNQTVLPITTSTKGA
ncbi:nose resistant to fluoxetine protein 6-like [Eupeodes corollae]|uniref:nose resistant to fluoxetine protein 6-like n=1 Tax=Eupeodes corollae TaxID=290404 RepID=UPI002493B9CE|nr:nose resistant to fluoxetine protein 6-like [Eupeodes corollae]